MSSSNLFNLLVKLESSKIKDRNDALSNVEQLIESNQTFTNKDLTSLCEALFAFIENEKSIYIKSKAAAAESRLQSSSYMLRRLVVQNAKRMKFKLVKQLLNFSKEIIYEHENGIVEPLALNVSRIINTLVSIDQHRDHIASDDWVKLIEAIIRILNKQIKSNMTEKYVFELLCALRVLIVNPLIAIEDLEYDLSDFLVKYFTSMKKESSLTAIVLEITNNMIITLSTSKVRYSLKLVKCVLKISGTLVDTNYETLRDQLLVFGLLANEFICENLPKLIEVESSQGKNDDDDGIRDDLIFLIDQWIQHALKTPGEMLSLQNIEFLNSETERSWFNFGPIRLEQSSSPRPWLSTFALAKLIHSVHQLKRPLIERPPKRKKLESTSYASLIHLSENPIHLFMHFINSTNSLLQKLGFQTLTFYIYNYVPAQIPLHFDEIVAYYDKPELCGFTSLLAKSLIESGWKLNNSELSQILRINLQLIKDKNVVNIASQIIIQILNYTSFIVSDNSIYLQIQSVFEIPEINGPIQVTNDSLKFWVVFSQYGKGFKSQNKKVGDKIVDWLLTKWNTNELVELTIFPHFVSWLAGSDFRYNDEQVTYEDTFYTFWAKWSQKSSLACFILRSPSPRPLELCLSASHKPKVMIGLESLTPIIDQLLLDMEGFDSKAHGYALLRIVKYAHFIYQNIQSLSQLDSCSERLKYDIRRFLENLKSDQFDDYNEAVFELSNFKILNESGEFILECLNPQEIASAVLLHHEKSHETHSSNDADSSIAVSDFGEFGQVRKVTKDNSPQYAKTYLDLKLYSTVEQKVLRLVISLNSEFSTAKNLNTTVDQALRVLENLQPEGFSSGLLTLLNYLEDVDTLKIQTVSISKLIRLVGHKLLPSYQSERSPITMIIASKLFILFNKAWLLKITEKWALDYSDMFKWIMSLAEKGLIAEEISLCYFIKSLFLKLCFESNTASQNLAFSLFHKSSNFSKVELCDSIRNVIQKLSSSEQTDCLEAICSGFINPQHLDDSAATFAYCIGELISISYTLFVGGVSQLLLKYGYLHFAPYIEKVFSNIGYRALHQESVLLEVLKFWYEAYADMTLFPCVLFGYDDQISFNKVYKHQLYSILVSNKRIPISSILNNDLMKGSVDESDLLLETLSLSIPLSYAKNGRRSELLKLIIEAYDSSLIEHQCLLVVARFLEFCNFSKESDFQKYIPSIDDNKAFSCLFVGSTDETDGGDYSPVNLNVPFSVAVHQINKITSSSKDFWSPASVLFLTKNIIKSLNSLNDDKQKIMCLRRLKLVIALGQKGFQNQDVVFSVVELLSTYIGDKVTHDQVCNILVTLLELVKGHINNFERYYAVLLMVLHETVRYKKKTLYVCYILERFLMEENSNIEFPAVWKMLVLPLVHLLTLDTASLGELLVIDYNPQVNTEFPRSQYISVHDILRYVASEKSEKMRKLIFNVLSIIFDEILQLNELDWKVSTDKDVACLLFELKLETSKAFNLFKSRYLASHFLLTGETLSEPEKEISTTIEYDLDDKTGSLFGVFDELLRIKRVGGNLEETFMIDCVLGVAYFEHNCGALGSSPLLSFDRHLKDQVKLLSPLDLFTFKLINTAHPKDYQWSVVAKDSGIAVKSATNLCKDIVLAILQTFVGHSPIFTALMIYIYNFPDVSKSIIYQLFLFYIRCGCPSGDNLALVFISGILEREDVFQIPKENIEVVLKICYFLRINKDDVKFFNDVFQSLDWEKVYKLACHVGLPKLGLLFFEVCYSDQSISAKWENDSKTLRKIYENLNDDDLLHGLPVDPSLGYAMNAVNRSSENSWKRVVFNSADLDSSIALGYPNVNLSTSKSMMLKSFIDSGLKGVSEMLNDTMDPRERLSNSYEWCWKLDQWDFPSPDTPATENEAIYKVLKGFNDDRDNGKLVCEELLVGSLSNRQSGNITSVLRKLCALHTIETVQSLKPSTIFQEAAHFIECTEKWFPLVSFSEIENIMLTRKVSYSNRSSSGNINFTDGLVAELSEMRRYGYYARLHGEFQRATNAAMWVDKRIRGEMNQHLKLYLSKISSFESACTLWNQGEAAISIAMLKDNLSKQYSKPRGVALSDLEIYDSVLHAHLVEWTSESRQEKFETIMQTYVKAALKDIDYVSSAKEKAKVYHILGYFCYKQTNLSGAEEEIERQEKLIRSKQAELRELKLILQNKSTTADEKKNAKRYYQRVQLQYESDKETFNILFNNRATCIEKALEFFMKAVSIDDLYDDEDIDKICALWLEYSGDHKINKIAKKETLNISAHKFIPWINQLMSRLSDDSTVFQQVLRDLLVRICLKHPFHSLYFVMNLRVHQLYQFARADSTINSRSVAAEKLWQILSSHNEGFTKTILKPIDTMSKNALSLATEKIPNNNIRKMNLENLKIGDFWINQIKELKIPLPTMNHLKISLDGNYTSVPRIISVDPILQISSSGISLPKIMKVYLSNGLRHKMLLKGSTDDLRQDAIMEQVFEKVNTILKNDKETRKRDLKMRTYKVIPLGPQAGMIEFVANSIALSDILRPLHSDDSISFSEAREMMRVAQSSNSKERLNVYLKIAKATPPVFRVFFYDTFPNIDDWYRSRQVYTRGIATNSIVGYMLGLGDRHLNNILIDKRTGEPIHIDLGVAFDQGKLLPVPELVPFRLTRDIVDGLGITGVEGSFTRCSEHVFRVLRSNIEKILGILNVLKYDPLYSWAISPIRKKRLQEVENEDNISSKSTIEGDGSDAVRALKGVETKLNANGLSIEASVQELIQEATDYKNLGVIYLGWTPFY